MSVINFPSRVLERAELVPRGPLDCDTFQNMRDWPFSEVAVDDDGVLHLTPEEHAQLDKFFAVYGLKLPEYPCFETTHELFWELASYYAKPAAVALMGNDPTKKCAKDFTPELIEYGKAIAAGETAAVARIARQVFAPKGFGAFCV